MKFLPFLLLILILIPSVVWAVDTCSILPKYSATLCRMLNNIAGALYIIGGGIALIVILVGGISIMTAGGVEDKLNKGKKILLYGLIGAAIFLCAGFLLDLLAEFLAPLIPSS